jgi:DNA-directed RNA polymerase subunit RPC12/RpoP
LIDLELLRCVKCGAPLPKPEGEYVKCEYCGYVQRIVDSREYMDKLRGEIFKWISEMIPPAVITSEVADVVARHNLFVYNVKPRLIAENSMYRARLSLILSDSVIRLPQWDVKLDDNPKGAYEKLARIEGLSPLVVVDEDRAFFSEVMGNGGLYAYLLNALSLINEKADFDLIKRNLEEASKYAEGRNALQDRIKAASLAYDAINSLFNGDPKGAKMKADEALSYIKKSREEANNPEYAFMIPGIEKEIRVIETIENLSTAAIAYFEAGEDPNELMARIWKFFSIVEKFRKEINADISVYREISQSISDIISAKTGKGEIELLPGEGDILIPMWLVSITYTFVTGVLMAKKGKMVEDVTLVSAIPAENSVSDVFMMRSGKLMDMLKGREEKLSRGSEVIPEPRRSSISWSTAVIPPVITREQADRLLEDYLAEVSRRTGGKVKFGTGTVKGLVFVPAKLKGDIFDIPVLKEAPVLIKADNLVEVAL